MLDVSLQPATTTINLFGYMMLLSAFVHQFPSLGGQNSFLHPSIHPVFNKRTFEKPKVLGGTFLKRLFQSTAQLLSLQVRLLQSSD